MVEALYIKVKVNHTELSLSPAIVLPALHESIIFLTNYVPKCQMSSGSYGPVFALKLYDWSYLGK